MLTESESREVVAWVEDRVGRAKDLLASGHQANTYLYRGERGKYVIKVPRGRGLGRLVRRWMLRNEYRVYRHLGDFAGIPHCYEMLRGRYLVLEYLDAENLKIAKLADREAFFDQLLVLVERLHEAGVAHGDLRKNVLLGPGERPFVIDFGTAVRLRPRSPFRRYHRYLFENFRREDRYSWTKLKYGHAHDGVPDELEARSPRLVKRGRRLLKQARRLIASRSIRQSRSINQNR